MKNAALFLVIVLLAIPVGVFADHGDSYPGMMYGQNTSGQYGQGMDGYCQNWSGQYGPGMMGYCLNDSGQFVAGANGFRQNGTWQYGPGMMYGENGPGTYGPGLQYGMMNAAGYGNFGIWSYLMAFAIFLVVLLILVWIIAGILLIIWLHKQISAK